MIALLIFGILLVVIGIMTLVAPDALQKLNSYVNKVVFDDGIVFSHRIIAGIIILIVGLWLLAHYLHYALNIW